ncbi:MAG TPA: ABC transporter permease [Dehalococcoidia bacterium]|nr:ABC transporter permease [Dehalococcoidia bacterium]
MSLADSFLIAFEALAANKMRAALTMLGIIIGVGAVIALMAVGQGSQKAVTDRIAGLGSNLIFIRPGAVNQSGVRSSAGSAQTLTLEDAQAIAAGVNGVVAAAPEFRIPLQISAGGTNTNTPALGVTPEYAEALNLTLAGGQFITQDDVDRRARVVVLGASVAQTLFPDSDGVGQQVRFGFGRNLVTATVVGVLQRKGGNTAQSQDNQVYIPISTAQTQIQISRTARAGAIVSQITVQVSNKSQIDRAKVEITELLSQRHRVVEPDFTVESQEDITEAVNQVSETMTVLLGSIAGISLVVGGIGIMNIMLVSVTERTREIGIRKAVGATRSDIMMQFLTEALAVTVAGGLIGIAAGIGAARLLDGRSIAGLGSNVQTVISWTSVVVAFGVSAAIGLFFGLYPASRAAKLNPIQALRYE